MMGTDPFFMYRDRRSYPFPDPPFVIRSFADPDHLRTRSGSDRLSIIAILTITDHSILLITHTIIIITTQDSKVIMLEDLAAEFKIKTQVNHTVHF